MITETATQRTQIYLTAEETKGVARVAAATKRNRSEVIREAIDQYLQRVGEQDQLTRLQAAKGMWKDHEELDLAKMRAEFDRF